MRNKQLGYAIATLLAATSPASADITNTVGLTVITPQFLTLTADALVNNPQFSLPSQVIFSEQQNVTLLAPLATDNGLIPAGTTVSSYFVILNDSKTVTETTVSLTAVTFDSPVLGIIYTEDASYNPTQNFALSNFLGRPGLAYDLQCFQCAFESTINGPFALDTAIFSGNTAAFFNHYSNPGDVARIITEGVPVPGPIVGAGLPGIVAAFGVFLGWFRRRKNKFLGRDEFPQYKL